MDLNNAELVYSSKKLIFNLVLLIFSNLFLLNCKPTELPVLNEASENWSQNETKRAKEEIQKSTVLQNLDSLCRNLPFVHKFNFRSLILSNKSTFLTYHYNSDLDFDEIKEELTNTLISKGWETAEEWSIGNQRRTFKNKHGWVRVDYFGKSSPENDNYIIECGLYD